MAFEYLDGFRSNPWTKEQVAAKTLKMRLDEVRYRARLLRALGHDEKTVLGRIQHNLSWEYEVHGDVGFSKAVKDVVTEVFARREIFGNVA